MKSPSLASGRRRRSCLLILVSTLAAPIASPASGLPGLVVERVDPGSGWELAGLQPGDVLRTWTRAGDPAEQGALSTPFDLAEVVTEQWPRGEVTLEGSRDGRPASWSLPRGSRLDWPTLQLMPAGGELDRRVWALVREARDHGAAGRWPEADAAYRSARELLGEREPRAVAHLLREQGELITARRGDAARAKECFERALALDERIAPDRLAVAWDLLKLGKAVEDPALPQAAEALYLRALAILERRAPASFARVACLGNLGALWFGTAPAAASRWLERALAVQEGLEPESPAALWILSSLGSVTQALGESGKAEEYLLRALALQEKSRAGGAEKAYRLSVLGVLALNRGDLEVAEDHFRQALALYEGSESARRDGSVANAWNNLGTIALLRGEPRTAQRYFLRALPGEEVSPSSRALVEMACSLRHLGVLRRDVDPAAARAYFQRALALYDQVPQSLDRSSLLGEIALFEAQQGNVEAAFRSLDQAFALAEAEAPSGVLMARTLSKRGALFEQQGELERAGEDYRRALALYERLGLRSADRARVLFGLGTVQRRTGRRQAGAESLCRAVDAVDDLRARLGGTAESRSAFGAAFDDVYHDCAAALIEDGQPERAFHTLERGRASSLLTLLGERELRFADLPAELAEQRRRLDAEYDRTQAGLLKLDVSRDAQLVERLRGELDDVRRQQEEIVRTIRRQSPRFASLQYPEPVDLAGARAALDPGTVLLSYSIGRERSHLFVVRPPGAEPGLAVYPLPVGRETLRGATIAFVKRLRLHRSDLRGLRAEASRLYELLVRPADAALATSERVLIVADGPLHTLPFAALVRDGRYLVEWKPLHTALSATVYAEIKKARPAAESAASSRQVVAFGDPRYPQAANAEKGRIADPRVRGAVQRGLSLTPLPGTRKEVEAIAAVFPDARVYLGTDATEERAKSEGRRARLLHFACHGLLDEDLPLSSALALTIPEGSAAEGDNGLLQAWEIFEHVGLDADLVTLSACDTALGKEQGGEGLIGLTRAFQYAGARSVLASLWGVPDAATSLLMPRFYRALRAGRSKDDALRAAQIEQIGERRYAHPFFWAAFQLAGDWR